MSVDIRRLAPGDERLLRATRLAALADAPGAFGTTFESAQARDDEWWARQVAGRLGEQPCATWVAVDDDGRGVGMVTSVDTGAAVDVLQVWIAPEHRGTGLIERLFDEVFAWAPHARIDLDVAAGNDRAKRVYERLGFSVVGERQDADGLQIEMTQRRDPAAR